MKVVRNFKTILLSAVLTCMLAQTPMTYAKKSGDTAGSVLSEQATAVLDSDPNAPGTPSVRMPNFLACMNGDIESLRDPDAEDMSVDPSAPRKGRLRQMMEAMTGSIGGRFGQGSYGKLGGASCTLGMGKPVNTLSCSPPPNPELLARKEKEARGKNDLIDKNLYCQEQKLSLAGAELSCLQRQSQALENMYEELKTQLQNILQQHDQALEGYRDFEEDRNALLQSAHGKLNGSGDTKGLVKLQEEVREIVNTKFPQQLAEAKNARNDLKETEKSFEHRKEIRAAEFMKSCFETYKFGNQVCNKTTVVEYTDPKTGATTKRRQTVPAQGAKTFLPCLVKKYAMLGPDGRPEKSGESGVRSRAEALEKEMDNILEDMLGSLANRDSQPGAVQPQGGGQPSIISKERREGFGDITKPTDLDTGDIGNRIRQLDGKLPNLNLFGEVKGVMGRCYNGGVRKVNVELTKGGTELSLLREGVKTKRNAFQGVISGMLDAYSGKVSEVYQAITDESRPFSELQESGIAQGDLDSCRGADPDKQLQCAERLQGSLRGLLSGRGQNSSLSIPLKGVQTSELRIPCNGLDGCVTTLKRARSSLGQQVRDASSKKRRYIKQANSILDNYMNGPNGAMKFLQAQGQNLQGYVSKLNGVLTSLGVSGGDAIEVELVKGEGFKRGTEKFFMDPNAQGLLRAQNEPESGLYQIPQGRMMDVLGGIELNPRSIASATSAVQQRFGEIKIERSDLETAKLDLEDSIAQCKATSLQKLVNKGALAGCAYSRDYCDEGGNPIGNFQEIVDQLQQVEGDPDIDTGEYETLSTSIAGLCATARSSQNNTYIAPIRCPEIVSDALTRIRLYREPPTRGPASTTGER